MSDNDRKQAADLLLAENVLEGESSDNDDFIVGYDMKADTFQLIVKHSGNIRSEVEALAGNIKELSYGFSIVELERDKIDKLASEPKVIYIELPHDLFFSDHISSGAACIMPVLSPPYSLSGEGVLLGIVDSGIDVNNSTFWSSSGECRILKLWDMQSGIIYTRDDIAKTETAGESEQGSDIISDPSGHGTAVAEIMAGKYGAYKSDILAVKLRRSSDGALSKTSDLMEAVEFLIKEAKLQAKPIAINISLGSNYGAHDGNELVSQYINAACADWKSAIVCAVGNEAGKGIHNSVKLSLEYSFLRNRDIEIEIGKYETSVALQIWKYSFDKIDFELYSPFGERVIFVNESDRFGKGRTFETDVFAYYSEGNPFSDKNEVYVELIGRDGYIFSGVWTLRVLGKSIIDGEINMWLSDSSIINEDTTFLSPKESYTITVPATAGRAVSVGAYSVSQGSVASFSGRGGGRDKKPEIMAPGVEISTVSVNNRPVKVSGTSFSAPFVTASAALLMEWGIVRGNDPFLYGEKLKSALIAGAVPFFGQKGYSEYFGYGKLCLKNSLDKLIQY